MGGRLDSWYDRSISARFAAVGGLALAPSFVLGRSLPVVGAQLGTMLVLTWVAGVRLRPVRTVTFIGLVVAFNLLSPAGRVLATVASLPVTVGALTLGLERATTLTSLLLLSKLAIRPRLRLPGRLGALTTLTLGYLRELLALPVAEMVRRPTTRLDELLLQLHFRGIEESVGAVPNFAEGGTLTTAPLAAVSAGLLVVASWVAALLSYTHTG